MEHKKLFAYIDTHASDYSENMRAFLTQWCDSAHPQALLALLLESLHRLGCTTQFPAGVPWLLYAERSCGAPHTLLLYDRVLSQDSTRLDASVAHVVHDVFMRLAAIDAYLQAIGPLPVNIKWLLDAGKEPSELVNLLQTNGALAELCQADACLAQPVALALAEEAPPYFSPGTRGQLSVELVVRTAAQALPAEASAIVPNAAWRLTWALSSIKKSQEEVCIDGFYDTLTPLDDDEIAQLHTLPENAAYLARLWGLPDFLLGLQGFQLHYTRFLVPSCTIRTFQCAVPDHAPAIPERAEAILDFNLVPGQDPRDIFTQLQQHLLAHGFPDVQARRLTASAPAYVPVQAPFVQALRRATTMAYDREPYILPMAAQNPSGTALQTLLGLPVVYPGVLPYGALDMLPGSLSYTAAIKQVALLFKEMSL